jgi:hypothetical protein
MVVTLPHLARARLETASPSRAEGVPGRRRRTGRLGFAATHAARGLSLVVLVGDAHELLAIEPTGLRVLLPDHEGWCDRAVDVAGHALEGLAGLGAPFETGNTWADREDLAANDLVLAGSLFVGVDTFLGPAFIGYGRAEEDRQSVFLFIGRPF